MFGGMHQQKYLSGPPPQRGRHARGRVRRFSSRARAWGAHDAARQCIREEAGGSFVTQLQYGAGGLHCG